MKRNSDIPVIHQIEKKCTDDDFEAWEDDAALYYAEDWSGLVAFRQRKVEAFPGDLYEQWSLGEAYILNGEYKKAIEYLSGLHKKAPDDLNIQHSLLDALMAMGEDENSFDWIIKPAVWKLDEKMSDYCYDYLRHKRKPITVYDLYIKCCEERYPMFSDRQLMLYLYTDKRFVLSDSESESYNSTIKAAGKRTAARY